jgi:hypothetical protein
MTPREKYARALAWAANQAYRFPGTTFQANIEVPRALVLLVARVDDYGLYLRTIRAKR